MSAESQRRRATYDDLLACPSHVVAEIVHGVLHQSPRPALPQTAAASALAEELGPPFKRGNGGPGGWMILDEPELHLGDDIVVPDLAGWRRERLPEVSATPFLTLAPDWACEVLSPSTRALDRGAKLSIYAEHLVRHIWFVEPEAQLNEVLRLDGATYRIVGTASGGAPARLAPFDAVEVDLRALWHR